MRWIDEEPRADDILDFWEAYDRIEPVRIGESDMLAQVGQEVSNLHVIEAVRMGQSIKPKTADLFYPTYSIHRERKKPKTKKQSPRAMLRKTEQLAAKLGFEV